MYRRYLDNCILLVIAVLFPLFFLFSCGETSNPVMANIEQPDPKPVIAETGSLVSPDVLIIEVTQEEIQRMADAMKPGVSGSDPYYGFWVIDGQSVAFKRVDR